MTTPSSDTGCECEPLNSIFDRRASFQSQTAQHMRFHTERASVMHRLLVQDATFGVEDHWCPLMNIHDTFPHLVTRVNGEHDLSDTRTQNPSVNRIWIQESRMEPIDINYGSRGGYRRCFVSLVSAVTDGVLQLIFTSSMHDPRLGSQTGVCRRKRNGLSYVVRVLCLTSLKYAGRSKASTEATPQSAGPGIWSRLRID